MPSGTGWRKDVEALLRNLKQVVRDEQLYMESAAAQLGEFVSAQASFSTGTRGAGLRPASAGSKPVPQEASTPEARTGPTRPSEQSGTGEGPGEAALLQQRSVVRASSSEARTGPTRPSKQSGTGEGPAEAALLQQRSVVRASSSEETGLHDTDLRNMDPRRPMLTSRSEER